MTGYHLIDPLGHEAKILEGVNLEMFYLFFNEWVRCGSEVLEHFTGNPMTEIYRTEFSVRR